MIGRQIQLTNIPNDVLLEIFSLLSLKSLLAISQTSKQFNALSKTTFNTPKFFVEQLSAFIFLNADKADRIFSIMKLIQHFRLTATYKKLKHRHHTNKDLSYSELICYALTTDDIKTIDPVELKKAIQAAPLIFTNIDKLRLTILNGLNMTVSAIKKDTNEFINCLMIYFVNLAGADLSEVNWTNFNKNFISNLLFESANFEYANLSGIDLRKFSWIYDDRFNEIKMTGYLPHAILKNGRLENINLADSILDGVDLTSANLSGAKLPKEIKSAILCNANWEGVTAKFIQPCHIMKADLVKKIEQPNGYTGLLDELHDRCLQLKQKNIEGSFRLDVAREIKDYISEKLLSAKTKEEFDILLKMVNEATTHPLFKNKPSHASLWRSINVPLEIMSQLQVQIIYMKNKALNIEIPKIKKKGWTI